MYLITEREVIDITSKNDVVVIEIYDKCRNLQECLEFPTLNQAFAWLANMLG